MRTRKVEDLPGAQRRREAHLLRRRTDAAARTPAAWIASKHANPTARRPAQADDEADERRLPGAVRPEQRDELAPRYVEIDLVDRCRRAEALLDLAQ